jgi:hypothetical protein
MSTGCQNNHWARKSGSQFISTSQSFQRQFHTKNKEKRQQTKLMNNKAQMKLQQREINNLANELLCFL